MALKTADFVECVNGTLYRCDDFMDEFRFVGSYFFYIRLFFSLYLDKLFF